MKLRNKMADSCWPLKLVNTLKGLIVLFSYLYILNVSTLPPPKKRKRKRKQSQTEKMNHTFEKQRSLITYKSRYSIPVWTDESESSGHLLKIYSVNSAQTHWISLQGEGVRNLLLRPFPRVVQYESRWLNHSLGVPCQNQIFLLFFCHWRWNLDRYSVTFTCSTNICRGLIMCQSVC